MIRPVIPMVRIDAGNEHFPPGTIGGRLEDFPTPPGWMDLPEDDERYLNEWKVEW